MSVHPAADHATSEALVVEQDRSVVPLSTWLADAAVVAAGSRRLLQIVTPADSRITYPLELLLCDGGSQWIVRSAPGFRDGFTGAPMGWTGTRFAPIDGPVPEPDPGRDPALGSLEVQISTLHAAAGSAQLGTSTAAVTRALCGSDPTGWSTAEPVAEPWSAREVTSFCCCRDRGPTNLVVVAGGRGRRVVGRLHVRPVTGGVLEEVRVAGPAAVGVGQAAIEELAGAVATTARSMLVTVHPTRTETGRSAEPSPPPVPYGMLVGAAVVAERGLALSVPSVPMPGGGRTPALWCRFDAGPAEPNDQLSVVLRHFGLSR